jgi:hypothetical protein
VIGSNRDTQEPLVKAAKAYIVIAGLAIVAAAATRPPRRRAVNPLERDPEVPETGPDPEHVGQEGFAWPMEDRFRNPADFQRALELLGYELDVDGDVLGDRTKATVEAFKLDWNVVTRQAYLGPLLGTGGFIDLPTVPAIAGALHHQRVRGEDWFEIVNEALELSKPEVG